MGTDRVVVTPPSFDHDLRFLQRVEEIAVDQFVAQLAVETLAVAVFRGTSWLDVSGLGSKGGNPLAKGGSNKLRTVVRTDVCRNTPRDEQLAEQLDHVDCLELSRNTNGQALMGNLIDDA